MAQPTVEVEFYPQDLLNDVENKLQQALENIALAVEAEAKPLSPIDTGALRGSIETAKMSEDEMVVFVGVEYGISQENRKSYLKKSFDNVMANSAQSILEATFNQ